MARSNKPLRLITMLAGIFLVLIGVVGLVAVVVGPNLVMMSVAPAVAQEDPACGEVFSDTYTDFKDFEKGIDKYNEYCVPLGLPPIF